MVEGRFSVQFKPKLNNLGLRAPADIIEAVGEMYEISGGWEGSSQIFAFFSHYVSVSIIGNYCL